MDTLSLICLAKEAVRLFGCVRTWRQGIKWLLNNFRKTRRMKSIIRVELMSLSLTRSFIIWGDSLMRSFKDILAWNHFAGCLLVKRIKMICGLSLSFVDNLLRNYCFKRKDNSLKGKEFMNVSKMSLLTKFWRKMIVSSLKELLKRSSKVLIF